MSSRDGCRAPEEAGALAVCRALRPPGIRSGDQPQPSRPGLLPPHLPPHLWAPKTKGLSAPRPRGCLLPAARTVVSARGQARVPVRWWAEGTPTPNFSLRGLHFWVPSHHKAKSVHSLHTRRKGTGVY